MQKLILIVDDDIGLLNMLNLTLKREEYIIETLSNGKSLLKKLLNPPDLIILDKQLGTMHGAKICRHLKTQTTTKMIPIMLISAAPDLESIALDAHADGYLEKPFSARDLLDRVENLI